MRNIHGATFMACLYYLGKTNSLAPVFRPTGLRTTTTSSSSSPSSTLLFLAKRNKLSMAEKRKRRQQKGAKSNVSFDNLPKSQLDFTGTATAPSDDEPERLSDPTEAAEKAQKILQKQRSSVEMVGMVREKVEALPKEELLASIENSGYLVIDGFLQKEDVLNSLEREARSLYQSGDHMKVDMGNLGSGEYIVSIEGGTQYTKCPRSVELVVSTTKHVPAVLESLELDASACMATLRSFDHKAFKASLALLTGSEEEMNTNDAPFATVVTPEDKESRTDGRRLTLFYYVLPESWDESCGGGLEFETGGVVAAKRDRLVVWKSDSTKFRKQRWSGSEENPIGSCLELHLVQKKTSS